MNEDMMSLRILIRMSQKQRAIMIARGEEYANSPVSFEMSRAHAATIADMSGKYEITKSGIYAGFGGFESQLHIPYRMNLADDIADEIVAGNLKEGGNIDHILDEAAKIQKEV